MAYCIYLVVRLCVAQNRRTMCCLSKVVPIVNHINIFMCMSRSHDTAMDPPSSVQLVGIQNGQAQFRWIPIDSCSPVRYDISTNCSTQCNPMTTNLTTTNCPVTADVVTCDFSVQTVVCDNLMGSSRTAVITLQGV